MLQKDIAENCCQSCAAPQEPSFLGDARSFAETEAPPGRGLIRGMLRTGLCIALRFAEVGGLGVMGIRI